ncbi:kinase-like domain-containing protein [Boletus reticuloceps]|uniref:Kinase-like domain-containing protein n=1 Tax=Boletus reticuloceps TaxID=495285 RepID=A0A8I2YMX7_9AGAM|nr:kinase-like domain-containing protein [Boletus reticuloceps]
MHASNSGRFPNDLTDQVTRDDHDPVASGGFADIYRGVLQDNGQSIRVAIKAIKTYSAEDVKISKKKKRLWREIKVWLDLRHDNVLPLLGTTMGFGRFPAMVCPWVENGVLTSYLEGRYNSLSVIEILGLLNSVASGLQYLHSRSVVHGDLSGSNVLIHEGGRACIADFGLSMLLTELGASTFATSFHARGTLRWMAPELLDLEVPKDDVVEDSSRVGPTTQSDVYSFGSIMLQCWTDSEWQAALPLLQAGRAGLACNIKRDDAGTTGHFAGHGASVVAHTTVLVHRGYHSIAPFE